MKKEKFRDINSILEGKGETGYWLMETWVDALHSRVCMKRVLVFLPLFIPFFISMGIYLGSVGVHFDLVRGRHLDALLE